MSKKKLAGIIAVCVIAVVVAVVIATRPTPMYILSMSVSPPGAGSISPSGGEYESGMQVTLTANPASGYLFVDWTGDVDTIADVNAPSTTITMNDDYTISANFGIGIRDWYDLDAIRENLVGSYILMNDLDSTTPGYTELASPTANQEKGWQPIGTWDNHFTGMFDGHGHKIRGLFINRPDEGYLGVFGEVSSAAVIEDVSAVDADVTGSWFVGGLIGINGPDCTVSDCYSTGSVTGRNNVGGLMGGNQGTVSKSYSTGSVTGGEYVGGLMGVNEHAVSNCYSTVSVTGNWSVGGLVGTNTYLGTVSNSYSIGSVTGGDDVGGLVGRNEGGTVSGSFWDIETGGQATSAGGTGKATAEMQDVNTFTYTEAEGPDESWDITVVAPGETDDAYTWNIVDGDTYPFLSWQP
jgi:hypothetical protein